MTPKEKQLLLIDLCARLPYGVKVKLLCRGPEPKFDDWIEATLNTKDIELFGKSFKKIKPYLRPMSSLTEEEIKTINNISNKDKGFEEDEDGWIRCDSIHTKWGVWPDGCAKLLDYLNSIHIDYRGLIPMGLALEAREGIYRL